MFWVPPEASLGSFCSQSPPATTNPIPPVAGPKPQTLILKPSTPRFLSRIVETDSSSTEDEVSKVLGHQKVDMKFSDDSLGVKTWGVRFALGLRL